MFACYKATQGCIATPWMPAQSVGECLCVRCYVSLTFVHFVCNPCRMYGIVVNSSRCVVQAASVSSLFDFLISAVHSGQEPRVKSLLPSVKALDTTTTGGLSRSQIIRGWTELPSQRERYAIAGAPVMLPICLPRRAQHECMASLSAPAQHLYSAMRNECTPCSSRIVLGMQGHDRRMFHICVSVLSSKLGAIRGCGAYVRVCGHELDIESSWNRVGLCVPRQLAQARPTLNKRTCHVCFAPLEVEAKDLDGWANDMCSERIHWPAATRHLLQPSAQRSRRSMMDLLEAGQRDMSTQFALDIAKPLIVSARELLCVGLTCARLAL